VASTIGIKIANGEFYSIVEENVPAKKRLILTTVHDKQRSVQIDLYKSFTQTMADALYIGSLVVENIYPKTRGEPSIELVISSNENGEISADAVDMDSGPDGQHNYLSVSLRSLEESAREPDIPDFELEPQGGPPAGLLEKSESIDERRGWGLPWVLIICVGLFIAVVCLALWLLVFRAKPPVSAEMFSPPAQVSSAPSSPAAAQRPASSAAPRAAAVASAQPASVSTPRPTSAPTPVPPPTAAVVSESPRVIEAPASPPPQGPVRRRDRPTPPVFSFKVPAVIPRDGVPYQIRWGDTLWDISEAFYRSPWHYTRIAQFNRIANPDHIVSGTVIRIPPQN
jgi:nucleoid-associated protein YgaU